MPPGYPQQSSEVDLQGEAHQISGIGVAGFSGLHVADIRIVTASNF